MDSDTVLMGGEHMSKEKKYFETEAFRLEPDAFAELFLPEIQRFYPKILIMATKSLLQYA
jgi:hypothetical protein